jgi:predicted Zn finger-like uncharacterized protein
MPIPTRCPECRAQYSVPDSAAGKKVKCRQCEFVFPIASPKPKPSPKPAKPVDRDRDPWDTDEVDEEEMPVLKPAKKKKPVDGLPPKINKPKKKATYVSADDDEDEDEPRPKKKKRTQAADHDPRLMFLAIALGVVVLAGIAGIFAPQVTLWVGIIAIAGGGLWQLGMAFEEDDFTGWMHMRVPGYSLYFAISRISETWPAVVVQLLGAMLCVGYVVLEHRQQIGFIARAVRDPVGAQIESADPEDARYLKAARPFAEALAAKKYDDAFEELSPLAIANAYHDQFVPAAEENRERKAVGPLSPETFQELMTESEKVLGAPLKLEGFYVESRDPELMSGRGDPIQRAYVLGAIPDSIPASIRRAGIHATVTVKQPNVPIDPDDEEPYLVLRIIIVEEDEKLRVGYFELRPPSILE